FISHAVEEPHIPGEVTLVHNTVVNTSTRPMPLLRSARHAHLRLANNLFAGRIVPPANALGDGNVYLGETSQAIPGAAVFVDAANFDYRLAPQSPAIDKGVVLPAALTPHRTYRHPAGD